MCDARERLLYVAASRHALRGAPVLHAGNDDAVGVTTDDAVLVQQQVEAHLTDGIDGQPAVAFLLLFVTRLIDGIVVVAQHGKDAVAGLQLTEIGNLRRQFFRLDVLHVARKDDGIGMLGIDTIDGTLQHPLVVTGHRSHMGIGKLHDAIAVKGCRQVAAGKLDVAHLKLLKTDQHAVSHRPPYNNSTREGKDAPCLLRQQQAPKQTAQQGNDDEPHDKEKRYGETRYHLSKLISSPI